MTWGRFIDLVTRYRRACRELSARRTAEAAAMRDELGRQIDQLVAPQLAALAAHRANGQRFPTLVTTHTMGGFRDVVAIHRFACHAFERDLSQNTLQDRDDSGYSIDELLRERQRRQLAGKSTAAAVGPDLFGGIDAAGSEEPTPAEIGGEQ